MSAFSSGDNPFRRVLWAFCVLCTTLWSSEGFGFSSAGVTTTREVHALVPEQGGGGPSSHIDRYRIWVLTFGPGDHPFSRFGHNALWVEDLLRRTSDTYNFGTFEAGPGIISDFLQGRLYYWLSVSSLRSTLLLYESQNRDAWAQRLSLSWSQAERLVGRLKENALPQNRAYKYDYYLDNCSTRLRDVLDDVTSGALRAVSSEPQRWTWRENTLRLSQDDWLLSLGLDFALGPKVDRLRTVWEEMFLPQVLRENLRRVTWGAGGPPLVVEERVLLSSNRAAEHMTPPSAWVGMLLLGSLLGLGLVQLAVLCRTLPAESRFAKMARRALYFVGAGWGLVAGALGSLLVFLWLATDHDVVHRNANILIFPPWALLLFPLGLLAPRFASARRPFFFSAAACLISSVGAGLLWVWAVTPQDIRQFLALAVPIWGGLTFSAWDAIRGDFSPKNAPSGEPNAAGPPPRVR